MEYKNINFDADKVKQHEAVREAINSATLKISFLFLYMYVFLDERYLLVKDRFCFCSIILSAFNHTRKLKTEPQQKTRPRKKQGSEG